MKRLLLTLVLLALAAPVLAQSAALTRATYARDADTQKRVTFLAVKVSLAVMAEDPATCCGATPELSAPMHDKRARMAAVTLRDPEAVAFRVTLAVLTNTAIVLSSTDAEIEATLVAQWNAYAEAMAR